MFDAIGNGMWQKIRHTPARKMVKKYPFLVTYLYLLGTPRHSAVPGNVFCSKTSPPRTKTFAADGAVGAVAVRCDAISSCDGANVSEVAA